MKCYIFFTPSIVSIGGAELYVSGKLEHLRSIGWKPIVFSFSEGVVKIKNLKDFSKYISGELAVGYAVANTFVRKKLLKRIKEVVAGCDEVFIESHTTNLSYWGEYISSHIQAVHLSYLLTETFPKLTGGEHNFFIKKKEQGLLRGIQDISITKLFADGIIYDIPKLCAVGCVTDNVIDYNNSIDFKQYRDSDFKILSLGRLNKPYIPDMLIAIRNFSRSHPEYTINVTLVGGYYLNEVEVLCSNIEEETGVMFIHIDECNPIPSNIFTYNDMAIAVAGCAGICTNQGLQTITVDANDKKAIGILEITTKNSTIRVKEPPVNIETFLEDILINKKYGHPNKNVMNVSNYEEHDILLSAKQEDYTILKGRNALEWILYLILLITGVQLYRFLLREISSIRRR